MTLRQLCGDRGTSKILRMSCEKGLSGPRTEDGASTLPSPLGAGLPLAALGLRSAFLRRGPRNAPWEYVTLTR